MPSFALSPSFTLLFVLAWVVVLVLAIGRADRIVPRDSALEAWVTRWTAAGQALVGVAGALVAIRVVYESDPTTRRWLTVAVVLIACWASRRALSDWANGVTLRSEGTLRTGARIGVEFGRGRIRRLGLRSAEVEAEDGRMLRMPYTRLAEADIEISSEDVAAKSHTFAVDVEPPADQADLAHRMVTEALLSPWSSAQPAPSVRLLGHDGAAMRFEVTVYPVDPSFASHVEGAVRASVVPPAA